MHIATVRFIKSDAVLRKAFRVCGRPAFDAVWFAGVGAPSCASV